MKRLFTLAIVAMIASFSFAQAPKAQKQAARQIEKTVHFDAQMRQAMEMKAAQAEKAAAAQETAGSVIRRSVRNDGAKLQLGQTVGTVINSLSFNAAKNTFGAKYVPSPARVQETVGNVVVTTDANGIITDVTGVEPSYYTRSNDGTAYFYSVSNDRTYYDAQSGTATIIFDGDNVYMKNPISRYEQGSWVKGTKSGNTITVPARQPLAYNSNYNATISLRWGCVNAAGIISVADDNAEAFTFTVDGNVITLEGTKTLDFESDCYYMGAFWDDDDTATGYGDAETVLTLNDDYVAPSTELVVVPDGAEIAEWYMNGYDAGQGTNVKNRKVTVASDELDFYVKGLSAEFPESWVKGTLDMQTLTVTFPKGQFLGKYGTYDIWFMGYDASMGDLCDAKAVYDNASGSVAFTCDLAANAAADRLYYLELYQDVVMTMDEVEFTEPVLTDLTAELPYVNGFDTEAEQAEVAIYDANEDGKTFAFYEGTETSWARYTYNSAKSADDYLVFPGLALKAGATYKVTVDAKYSGYTERVEVVAGKEAKASKLNIPVIDPTEIVSRDFVTLANGEFTVAEDGTYYFAVHAISDPDEFYLDVDNFTVMELSDAAPVAVADLAVVADAAGANEATVSFTVPATTLAGDAITGNVNVVVTRNGEEVKNETKAAGAEVSFVDEVPAPGFYTYAVVAEVDGAKSEKASVKAYVGEDTPDSPSGLKIVDRSDKLEVSWNVPTEGVNGGILVPEHITYNLYPVEMEEFYGWLFPTVDFANPYATGLTATNAVVEASTNEGPQDKMYVAITAENAAGESDYVYSATIVGAPYAMPIHEPFGQDGLATDWYSDMDDDNYNGNGNIYFSEVDSDGNGSGLMFLADCAGWFELKTGKVAITGENPTLTFDYATDVPMTLKVVVESPAGDETVFAQEVTSADFVQGKVSLAEFVEQPFVRIAFRAEFDGDGASYLDNITLMDMQGANLAVAVEAPAKVKAGQNATITAKVQNLGEEATADYSVKFYVDDEEIAEVAGEEIAFYQTATLTAVYETSVFDEVGEKTVKVELVCNDEYEADNTDEVVFEIVEPTMAPVSSVEAKETAEGVEVSWTIDVEGYAEVTEDFEAAEAWSEEVEGWTIVDADNGPCGGSGDFEFNQSTSAWFVVDNTGIEDYYPAISGKKFMSTMYNRDGSANDEWLISPELPGVAQTVTFWAITQGNYGLEVVEVLYSDTDTDVDSFHPVFTQQVPTTWTQISFDIPEGAKYFAIRCVSQDIYMLCVDDVTYTAGGATPTGFNVYVDEALVAAVDGETTSYLYTGTNGKKFSVTAVYGAAESAPVSVELGVTDAINRVNVAAAAEVYTVDGIRLSDTKNLKPGVYVVNGKKVVVK